jgi:hypothetical protein
MLSVLARGECGLGSSDFDIFLEIQYARMFLVWP